MGLDNGLSQHIGALPLKRIKETSASVGVSPDTKNPTMLLRDKQPEDI